MKSFVKGLEDKFKEKREQEIKENKNYFVVLVKPKEVQDYIKGLSCIYNNNAKERI